MNTSVSIFTVILLWYLLNWLVKSPSRQLRIYSLGFEKVPKLLLKLAKIHKEGDVKWDELSSTDREKIMPHYQKFHNASSFRLTFLDSQNLIHVQQDSRGWFFPMDKGLTEIIREKVGSLEKTTHVEFVVYRKQGGWLRSPVLIGYLRKQSMVGLKDNEKETEILFEFPEAIMHGDLLNKRYISKYDLKEDKDVCYGQNDFGEYDGFLIRTYEQHHRSGSNFSFQIDP